MGANYDAGSLAEMLGVSIHAPVMGANDRVVIEHKLHIVSIHAPVMGAKLACLSFCASTLFQSTHP